MNHWKETAEVLARLAELAAAGERAAVATVVGISGSAYRRPGAKLLIEERGETLGSVSGGCLEADVREVAMAVLATGKPALRRYDTGSDEDVVWGLGLGCNGRVEVFIQPATAGPFAVQADAIRNLLAGDAPFALATVVEAPGDAGLGEMVAISSDGTAGSLGDPALDALAAATAREALPHGRSAVHRLGDRAVFLEALPPPPHLLVAGAGDDARPLVAYAGEAGFRVTVVDHRPALLDPRLYPAAARLVLGRPEDEGVALPPAARSLAVVKNHSFGHDREWARRLLAAGFPYVGLLGPRARTEAILAEIGAVDALGERVFGPVGLDLGADGPHQVAMAIVAELLAWTAGREPRHLAERREAIHAV